MKNFEIFGVPIFNKGSEIHIKEKNKGKFTDYCGGKVTDECIQRGKNSSNPTTRKRATFADNARKWKHAKGGLIQKCGSGAKSPNNMVSTVNGIQRGCKPGTNQCAQFQNQTFRDNGYYIKGNAWDLDGDEKLFNGYDGLDVPSTYDQVAVNKLNREAARNVYKNFDSKTLDVNQPYIVNMYYTDSKYQKDAYDKNDGVYGTHTGILTFDPDKKRWIVTHNINNNIYKDDFIQLQNGDSKYGVTAVSAPRKPNLINKIKYKIGLKQGGTLNE